MFYNFCFGLSEAKTSLNLLVSGFPPINPTLHLILAVLDIILCFSKPKTEPKWKNHLAPVYKEGIFCFENLGLALVLVNLLHLHFKLITGSVNGLS